MVDIYVDPDATGTGTGASWINAYTSLSAAATANATPGDDITYHCRSLSGTADTTAVSFSSTGGYAITVVGEDDFGGAPDTSSYRITVSAATTALTTANAITLENLQISQEGTGVAVYWNTSGIAVTIDGCLIRGNTSTYAIHANGYGGSLSMRNSIVYGATTSIYVAQNVTAAYLNNNTFSGTVTNNKGEPITARNCYAGNWAYNASHPDVTSAYGTSDYNASGTANTTGGSNDRSSQSPTWVDSANGDYHLQSGDTALRGYGTDLSSDTNYAVTDDIDGDTRSAWDIGADEYSSGATQSIVPHIMLAHNQFTGGL